MIHGFSMDKGKREMKAIIPILLLCFACGCGAPFEGTATEQAAIAGMAGQGSGGTNPVSGSGGVSGSQSVESAGGGGYSGQAPGFGGMSSYTVPRCDYISVCAPIAEDCSDTLSPRACGDCQYKGFTCGAVTGFYVSDGTTYVCDNANGMGCTAAEDRLYDHCKTCK